MLTIKKVGSPLFISGLNCKLTKYFPSGVLPEIFLIFALLSEKGLFVFIRENDFWGVVMDDDDNKSREIVNEMQVIFRTPLSPRTINLYYSQFNQKTKVSPKRVPIYHCYFNSVEHYLS